jgi:transcriptional regulator of acetoin/glycerol metabolism
VASFERDYLLHHLQLNEWNVSQTAQSIGIERTTLYKKIKTLGINQSDMGVKMLQENIGLKYFL